MADRLFEDLGVRHEHAQLTETESLAIFEQHNPLDEKLLREIETELVALTGASRSSRARVTVLGVQEFKAAVNSLMPSRLRERGLAEHIRVFSHPHDPHQVYVGPSALSGLNEGHRNVTSDLVYALIDAFGSGSNLAFERGAADMLAREVADRLELDIYTDHYPAEREFVETIIDAVKPIDTDSLELVGLLKRNPRQFFRMIRESKFYEWWVARVKQDGHSEYVDLIASLTSPTAQLEGSFTAWAQQCAAIYRDYRLSQQAKGQAGAAARWGGGDS